MRKASIWILVLAATAAGCGGRAALERRVDATLVQLETARASASPVQEGPPAPPGMSIYLAPLEEGETDVPVEAAGTAGETTPRADRPFADLSFGEIVKRDLKATPAALCRGAKHSFAKPENLLVLGLAFGADRIVRHNLDDDVREHLRDNDTSLAETDDFGTIIGNPALHFGIAGAWYLAAVKQRDEAQHGKAAVMIEALAVNGLATMLLKVGMDDKTPNDESFGWPSGHTSSSVCFAAVMHEYYGWKAALPLYALAGYSAATRLEDREHDLSDVVFGAALGWVVGHSVVRGELPEVAGFTVLPYASPDGGGGLLFARQW